jgi:hypothetical protein
VHGAHLLGLQAPWIVLFAKGVGPLSGFAHGVAAAAAASLVVARPTTAREVGAALALGVAVAAGVPPLVLLPIAAVAAVAGIAGAWTRAPEHRARRSASMVTGSAPVALGLALTAVLVRKEAVAIVRGAAAALVGGVVLALALRNNAVTETAAREAVALAAGGIPLSLATAGVAVRLIEVERQLSWLLLSTGTPARPRALAAASVSVVWGAMAGALYGAVAALMDRGPWWQAARVAILGVALGAALGGVAAHVARRADQPSGVDGTAATVGMSAAAIAGAVLATWLGAAAVALLMAIAAALVGSTPHLLARRERQTEMAVHLPWSGP